MGKRKKTTAKPKGKFSLVEDYRRCLRVLDEFVSDVERVHGKDAEDLADPDTGWIDLRITYLRAREIVRDDE